MAQTPILMLTYTLTTADALAYEGLRREMVGWRKWAFLLWLAGIGGVVAFLPVEWVGPEGGWMFWVAAVVLVGMGWLLAGGAMTLRTHARARRRIPAPVAVTVEQWGDHLAIDTGGRRTVIAWETIAAVNVAKDHVFIDAPPAVLIVPRRAFEDGAAMSAFADNIDQQSHDSAL